jgi:hypothetical protein
MRISIITLAVNCAGARSAGNPHATCEGAGLETSARFDEGGTPKGNGEQQIGRTYGAMAPVLDPTGVAAPSSNSAPGRELAG